MGGRGVSLSILCALPFSSYSLSSSLPSPPHTPRTRTPSSGEYTSRAVAGLVRRAPIGDEDDGHLEMFPGKKAAQVGDKRLHAPSP